MGVNSGDCTPIGAEVDGCRKAAGLSQNFFEFCGKTGHTLPLRESRGIIRSVIFAHEFLLLKRILGSTGGWKGGGHRGGLRGQRGVRRGEGRTGSRSGPALEQARKSWAKTAGMRINASGNKTERKTAASKKGKEPGINLL
jgi:hypothetical protein